MCGIFGLVSDKPVKAAKIVVACLRKLDYRGYDSWGVAVRDSQNLFVHKEIGPVPPDAETQVPDMESTIAIGHTRWATHGSVTQLNAHPHISQNNKITIVHNGIVENFQELKEELIAKNYRFITETDTEVIANLIEDELTPGRPLEEAVRCAFNRLEGRNAVVAMRMGEDKIIAAKTGSPLIIGLAPGTRYIASDIPVLLQFTREMVFLEDGEMAVIDGGFRLYNAASGTEKKFQQHHIEWTVEDAEKGEYPHFLLKEILDQKWSVKNAVNQKKESVMELAAMINNAYGTYMVGCGTAAHACRAATYIFSKIAQKHINFCIGSEFPYFEFFLKQNSLLIAASQSGETADILDAVKAARNKKAVVASLVNVIGSTLMRMSDKHLLLNAGPEKAVLSTKAFTSKLALFYLLAYSVKGKYEYGMQRINLVSESINKMLTTEFLDSIKTIAKTLSTGRDIYILGRGLSYPIALEGAHKIKEATYIHAEGFAGGEPKHCEISLVSQGTPAIIIAPNDETRHAIINNAMEFKARGAYIIGISPKKEPVFDYWIQVPDLGEESAIVNVIPMQLIAYYAALELGHNPDKPRNLAKSLTVK